MAFAEKKFAIRKLIKTPEGKINVVIVDAKTGQPVSDPNMYTIVEAGTTMQNPVDNTITNAIPQTTSINTSRNNKQETPSVTQSVMGSDGSSDNKSMSNIVASDENQIRGMSNNFGYVDKPGLLGLASFAPGPLGLAGKAVNTGINISNTAAVNDARKSLGMESLGFVDSVKGLVTDQKGYIGDISIPGSTRTTPVGFEAQDKYGRTTLTPQEAVNRMNATGAKPASKDEVNTSIKEFKQENPKQGLLSNMVDTTKNLFSNVFDGLGIGSSRQREYSPNEFPDTPQAPTNNKTGDYTTYGEFIGLNDPNVVAEKTDSKSQEDQAREGNISGLF